MKKMFVFISLAALLIIGNAALAAQNMPAGTSPKASPPIPALQGTTWQGALRTIAPDGTLEDVPTTITFSFETEHFFSGLLVQDNATTIPFSGILGPVVHQRLHMTAQGHTIFGDVTIVKGKLAIAVLGHNVTDGSSFAGLLIKQ